MKIIVASKNPVKINAVRSGFGQLFPDTEFEVKGLAVPSGVADQPMTDEETLKGADNRSLNAQVATPDADYWVGVEGGVEMKGSEMAAYAWILIRSKEQTGKARTAAFFLPPKIAELVNQGFELGEADDIVFKASNSKQQGGAVGLLTDNVIDRTSLYMPAVIMALIPFKNQALYMNHHLKETN